MIFSFRFLFALKSTASPTPAPVQSPPTAVPKEMLPLAYSSVIITDAAQLGIRPTRADANGWRNPMPF